MISLNGTISNDFAFNWLKNEPLVEPRPQKDGRIPCCIVLANFEESNIGPHCELQFSVPVRKKNSSTLKTLPNKPFSGILGLIDGTIAASLYNNTVDCVNYNRYSSKNDSFLPL